MHYMRSALAKRDAILAKARSKLGHDNSMSNTTQEEINNPTSTNENTYTVTNDSNNIINSTNKNKTTNEEKEEPENYKDQLKGNENQNKFTPLNKEQKEQLGKARKAFYEEFPDVTIPDDENTEERSPE